MKDKGLLSALGGYLPYGLKVFIESKDGSWGVTKTLTGIDSDRGLYFDHTDAFYGWETYNMYPLLRPLLDLSLCEIEEARKIISIKPNLPFDGSESIFDFLHSHFVDYRNLIGQGLAIRMNN